MPMNSHFKTVNRVNFMLCETYLHFFLKAGQIKTKHNNPNPKSHNSSRAAKLLKDKSRFTLTPKSRESCFQEKTPLCTKLPKPRSALTQGAAASLGVTCLVVLPAQQAPHRQRNYVRTISEQKELMPWRVTLWDGTHKRQFIDGRPRWRVTRPPQAES